MSYANIRLYNAVIPTYSSTKDKDKESRDKIINGDDPANRGKINKVMFDVNENE